MARDRVTSKNKAICTQVEETAGRSLPPPKLEDCLTGLREKPKGRQAGDLGSSGEGQWRRGGAMLLELGFKKAGMFSNWVSEQLRMAWGNAQRRGDGSARGRYLG